MEQVFINKYRGLNAMFHLFRVPLGFQFLLYTSLLYYLLLLLLLKKVEQWNKVGISNKIKKLKCSTIVPSCPAVPAFWFQNSFGIKKVRGFAHRYETVLIIRFENRFSKLKNRNGARFEAEKPETRGFLVSYFINFAVFSNKTF